MKISVITITYNSEKTLEETIQSVISQDYGDFEYIIVDGLSTDRTLEIVNLYKDKIGKIISEKDEGISDAFNKGIEAATGDIIAIINSDDILMPGALSKIADLMNEDTDVFYGNTRMFGDDRQESIYKPLKSSQLYKRMALIHPSTFITKNAYKKYGLYDIDYKCCMDRDLLLRMLSKGAKFQYCDFEFTRFRIGNGVSTNDYVRITQPEEEQISLAYGRNFVSVKLISNYNIIRFLISSFLRNIGIGEQIRKVFHSKQTILVEKVYGEDIDGEL